MSRTPAPVLTQAERDRRRLAIAFNLSLGFVGLLVAVFALQRWLPVSALAVAPRELAGCTARSRTWRPMPPPC